MIDIGPMLAASDFDLVWIVIVLVLTVGGAIANKIKEKMGTPDESEPPRRRVPPPQEGRRPTPPVRRPAPPTVQRPAPRVPGRPTPQVPKRPPRMTQTRPTVPRPQPPSVPRPVQVQRAQPVPPAARPPEPATQAALTVGQLIEEHAEPVQARHDRTRLAARKRPVTRLRRKRTRSIRLSPAKLRNAILLKEVLGPPVALRQGNDDRLF